MVTPEQMAERMKVEIIADVKAGTVPSTVATFSELHDYVDANCYGGSETLLDELDAKAPDTDEGHSGALSAMCDLMNPSQEIVDIWIKAGGIDTALTLERVRTKPKGMHVTVYRRNEPRGLSAPQAFLGDERPEGDGWFVSAKSDVSDAEHPPKLLLLGRNFLIYSMYHARDPHFLSIAVENFAAACEKLGYNLPLKEHEAVWLTYSINELDPAPPEVRQSLLRQIAAVFGTEAAKDQADALIGQRPSRRRAAQGGPAPA
jgi:hypothetical protein